MTPDLDSIYLQTAFAWLDALLAAALEQAAAAEETADPFAGLHLSAQQARRRLQPGVSPEWPSAAYEALNTLEKLAAQAQEDGKQPRLQAVATRFDLNPLEWQAWLIFLAPSLDARYGPLYGYLQNDITKKYASPWLVLHLLGAPLEMLPLFAAQEKLQRWQLIRPAETPQPTHTLLAQPFYVDDALAHWVLGRYTPPPDLEGMVTIYPPGEADAPALPPVLPRPALPSAPVLQQLRPFLSFNGPDRLRKNLAAAEVAQMLQQPLYQLQLPRSGTAAENGRLLRLAARDARLLAAVLYVQNAAQLLDANNCLLPSAFSALVQHESPVILDVVEPFRLAADMPGNDAPLMQVDFPAFNAAQRRQIWDFLLDGIDEHLTDRDKDVLAGQFRLNFGQMLAASSSAMSEAIQQEQPLTRNVLFRAARRHSSHHLGKLARKLRPRYDWEDLILPPTPLAMLQEMVHMVQARPRVLEEWGLGRKLASSTGISALFAGPPGTGKTMAAQVIANVLGLDLYRIDLSTVVSKYVGETEKQLEQIFSEASGSNAILFFDEADSLFGKRSEVKGAQDRYANIEVSYLLQRMEEYDGVAILATNLRANLDEAFTRRLQFIVDFPFPDETYRLRIWQVLMPPDLPRDDDLDLEWMAKRFKIAGGNIRNIILSAAYLAAAEDKPLGMAHLLHGARREFQKMGRLVQEEDFQLPHPQE